MDTDQDDEFHLRLGEPPPGGLDPSPETRPLRDVLGRFATGVTIVTSLADGHPVGMTCQSFASVSLEPPLVLFCVARASRSWPLIRSAGFFCFNLLAEGQAPLAEVMATRGADKFAGLSWGVAKTGAPLLEGAIGYVDCTVESTHDAGDHVVVVGRVEAFGAGTGVVPLIRYRSNYHGVGGPLPGT